VFIGHLVTREHRPPAAGAFNTAGLCSGRGADQRDRFWIKTVNGYVEGRGEAIAGAPDWRKTASAMCGSGSVLSTAKEFAGLIMTTEAPTAGIWPTGHGDPPRKHRAN
jgi:hypothetical protein